MKRKNTLRDDDFATDEKQFPNAHKILTEKEKNDVPMFTNCTNLPNSKWIELHDRLAKTVIDFFNENIDNIPEDANLVTFNFDSIMESAKWGDWVPESDSALNFIEYKKTKNGIDKKTCVYSN